MFCLQSLGSTLSVLVAKSNLLVSISFGGVPTVFTFLAVLRMKLKSVCWFLRWPFPLLLRCVICRWMPKLFWCICVRVFFGGRWLLLTALVLVFGSGLHGQCVASVAFLALHLVPVLISLLLQLKFTPWLCLLRLFGNLRGRLTLSVIVALQSISEIEELVPIFSKMLGVFYVTLCFKAPPALGYLLMIKNLDGCTEVWIPALSGIWTNKLMLLRQPSLCTNQLLTLKWNRDRAGWHLLLKPCFKPHNGWQTLPINMWGMLRQTANVQVWPFGLARAETPRLGTALQAYHHHHHRSGTPHVCIGAWPNSRQPPWRSIRPMCLGFGFFMGPVGRKWANFQGKS